MPPERLTHLFRRHVAATGSDGERGLGGSGLGLAICRGLVEAHGGRIRAESVGAGRGARFTFTVPVAQEASGRPAGPERRRTQPSREGKERTRILVVDDDAQTLRYVRDALTEAGYAAVVTGEPEELPDLVRMHRPALVLLDLLLPGSDGIELLERVPEIGDLPVIFISAYGRDETIVRALDAGAADYIVKPFSPSELTARVRAALRRRAGPEPFQLGQLTIHYDQRRVAVAGPAGRADGHRVRAAPRALRQRGAGADVLRAAATGVGANGGGDSGNPKLVRAVVKRLRRKLGDDAASPAYIRNERGVGYRMPGPGDL